jgi:hypothetical protein
MMSFRPTHFSRAFRSLDGIDDTTTTPTPTPTPTTTTSEEIKVPSVIVTTMDFERRPVQMPTMSCGCLQGACGCGRRRVTTSMNNMYALEYELQVLQMKLNWMIFVVFLLVCVLFFKR